MLYSAAYICQATATRVQCKAARVQCKAARVQYRAAKVQCKAAMQVPLRWAVHPSGPVANVPQLILCKHKCCPLLGMFHGMYMTAAASDIAAGRVLHLCMSCSLVVRSNVMQGFEHAQTCINTSVKGAWQHKRGHLALPSRHSQQCRVHYVSLSSLSLICSTAHLFTQVCPVALKQCAAQV